MRYCNVSLSWCCFLRQIHGLRRRYDGSVVIDVSVDGQKPNSESEDAGAAIASPDAEVPGGLGPELVDSSLIGVGDGEGQEGTCPLSRQKNRENIFRAIIM